MKILSKYLGCRLKKFGAMRALLAALMLMFGSQAGADAAKVWKVVSPSVVSVLPT